MSYLADLSYFDQFAAFAAEVPDHQNGNRISLLSNIQAHNSGIAFEIAFAHCVNLDTNEIEFLFWPILRGICFISCL
jgi:hypothetical protein